MIDHNPQYEIEARERENGFRDATANEIRQFREDENYRYRDRQLREEQSSRLYQSEVSECSRTKKHPLYRSPDMDNFVRLSRQTETKAERTPATMVNAITGLIVWVLISTLIWHLMS